MFYFHHFFNIKSTKC